MEEKKKDNKSLLDRYGIFIGTFVLLFTFIAPVFFIGYSIYYAFNNPEISIIKVILHSIINLWWLIIPYIIINIVSIILRFKEDK